MATTPSPKASRAEEQRSLPRIRTSVAAGMDGQLPSAQTDAAMSAASSSIANGQQREMNGATHQRFVLSDPVAFSYLEDDSCTTVLARNVQLQGYECYIVEQWVCSRTHPTFVITTYTGDPSHKVVVSVLSVPTDESAWSPQFRVYVKALNQYHARRRETPLGTVMVTNLSGFPSSLTVIPVPEGDIKKHRELFIVNEDLKRLGCSGRAGLQLTSPSGATQAKFHQLYRTSEKIPINGAVLELVRLCQIALLLFGKLGAEYVDGLLCDVTEKAINDWWVEFGVEFYNIEPHDGILGPTTVAALLGMIMGARNRLNAYGAPVSKDVFNVESTKRGIAFFQKSQRLPKSRRLDHQTLDRLRRATAKAASSEGWAMPRAVKSTVAELSGKGGEMVMEMVGARGKAGIADIETVDIERFVDLVFGERPKWLWHGKPRKSTTGDMFSRLPREPGLVFQQDEQGGYSWKSRRRDTAIEESLITKNEAEIAETRKSFEGPSRDPSPRRTILKKATGRISDARSGFERIKDAVGRRNHQSKHSRDEPDFRTSLEVPADMQSKPTSPAASPRSMNDATPGADQMFMPSMDNVLTREPTFTKILSETPKETRSAFISTRNLVPTHLETVQPELGAPVKDDLNRPKSPAAESSIAGSVYRGVDLNDILPTFDDPYHEVGVLLRHTRSATTLCAISGSTRNENRWPRHLSFSLGEERVLTWTPINDFAGTDTGTAANPKTELRRQLMLANEERHTREKLSFLSHTVNAWVSRNIDLIQALDEQAYRDQAELEDTMYYPQLDEYHALRQHTHDVLAQERSQLQDAIKDVEVLGAKLEYEINALRSKVEDVEDGVAEFERQVLAVEDRVEELEEETREKEGWLHWGVRIMTGIGKAPAAKR